MADALTLCPTPEKVAYENRRLAKRRAKQYHGQRPYLCQCGRWHLTSQVKGKGYAALR